MFSTLSVILLSLHTITAQVNNTNNSTESVNFSQVTNSSVSASTSNDALCLGIKNFSASERSECGYLGILESECTSRNCCYNPLPLNAAGPWCYKSNKIVSSSSCILGLAPSLRVDCGNSATTAEQCVSSGCCWDIMPNNSTKGSNCYKTPESKKLQSGAIGNTIGLGIGLAVALVL